METNIVFRNAVIDDRNNILKMYNDVRILGKHGTNDWDNEYPNIEILQDDIVNHRILVALKNCGIVGSVSWIENDDIDNEQIVWSNGKSLVVLRLCVGVEYQGNGIGKMIMCEMEKIARNMGYESLRLLASLSNIAANRTYVKIGYKLKGIANLYGKEFNIYEKVI